MTFNEKDIAGLMDAAVALGAPVDGVIGGHRLQVNINRDDYPIKPPFDPEYSPNVWVWRYKDGRFGVLASTGYSEDLANAVLVAMPPAWVVAHAGYLAQIVDEHVDDLMDGIRDRDDLRHMATEIRAFVVARISSSLTGIERALAVHELAHEAPFMVEHRVMQDDSRVWVAVDYSTLGKEAAQALIEDTFCWVEGDVWLVGIKSLDGGRINHVSGGWLSTDWLRNGAAAWVADKMEKCLEKKEEMS